MEAVYKQHFVLLNRTGFEFGSIVCMQMDIANYE